MSFCGTRDLSTYVKKREGDMPLLFTMRLALRVTERLHELHQKAIVHGDLKSNNVTLKFDSKEELESVHIIDYGMAKGVGF